MSKNTLLTGPSHVTRWHVSHNNYRDMRKDYDYMVNLENAKVMAKEFDLSSVDKQRLLSTAYAGADVGCNSDGYTDPDGLQVDELTCSRYHDHSFMGLLGETYDSDDMEPVTCPDRDEIKRLRHMYDSE